ncbi:hypothetical protein AYK24_00980 [Thermoplasmatales archaeon SG8-52-4]|nr:MAG: hypothetical protein AYK24_00980 [Thermoplasmatales archaeon SG8-52-4]
MKKIIFGVFVSLMLVVSVIAGSTSVNNKELNETVMLYEDGTIITSIPVGSYKIESKEQGDLVSIDDFGRLLIPGKPQLPTKIIAIAIPPGSQYVDLTYETGEGIILPGEYNIMPTPLPKVIGLEDPDVKEKEQQIYNENYETTYKSSEAYPKSIVEFERTAGFRKYNLVDVRINPFSYKPMTGKLTYYPDITVTVNYAYPKNFDSTEIMIDDVESFEQRASEFIINYQLAKDWYPAYQGSRESYNYVIVTTDSLTSSVQDLADWEESKGRSVKVVTTSWINSNYVGYDSAEKIRNFLIDKYPSYEWGIEYVCLIGSYSDVQIRLISQNTGYGQPETDFYHAELSLPDGSSWDINGNHKYCEDSDSIDYYAEVYMGRIPWSDPSTVESICAKTIAYEQNDDPSYKKNILLLGAFFWPDTDNAVLMEYKTDDTLHPWMSDWTMTKMYEEGQSTYPMDYNLNYNNVKTVWSQGTFAFVDWAGHGSPTACYEYYPSTAFVDTVTCNSLNDEYPAIVFADACSNSDTEENNIGQMMLKQGAVGFLGATKVAYGKPGWTEAYSGSSQSLDYFFTTGCTEGVLTQGESHQQALQEMYENSLWYYQKYEHCQWGALWGNPGLTMGEVVTSEPPANPEKPSGPDSGVPFTEFTFSTTTTDPEGENIYYLFDWGDGSDSGWIGPYESGQTGEASHIWEIIGNYEIMAKAKDENGAKSDWSEVKMFTVGDNTPPYAPVLDGENTVKPGELYTLKVTTTDPHDHDIYLNIYWGNGGGSWTGPYSSGETIQFEHTWEYQGTYNIKVTAKDEFDAVSDEAILTVEVRKNKAVANPILLQIIKEILGNFPLIAKLLL